MKRSQFAWWEEATIAFSMWLAILLSVFGPPAEHPRARPDRRGPSRR